MSFSAGRHNTEGLETVWASLVADSVGPSLSGIKGAFSSDHVKTACLYLMR